MKLSQKAQEMVNFWIDPRNIPFKGKLIDLDGIDANNTPCMCAQGQTLFKNGYTVEQLKNMKQSEADRETARILGISVAHSVLLRYINDEDEGAPQDVLSIPQKYLGPNWEHVLEFWWKLDELTEDQWNTIHLRYGDFYYNQHSEWVKATDEAIKAARETIGREFSFNVADAACAVYGWAADRATREIIGGVKNPVFLLMFDEL